MTRPWHLSTISIQSIKISSLTAPSPPSKKNKERDLALIALLLASGVRLSEAVNLDLKDLNLNMMVTKSLVKVENVILSNVANFAKPYLEAYLQSEAPSL